MSSSQSHKHSCFVHQNHKAQLANAYNELGKELSSSKIRVVGNYTLGKVIGEGAYGKVRMGTHRLTSTRVAIKQIPKAMSASLTREIHHHRQLHHPHVTQMFEVIATESSIWIVTELCCGGELFDYLVEKGRIPEEETKSLFGQLCLAVAYLHDNGIVHRDLKLENVLLDERCRVKLGDFGFTREFDRGSFMETFCGTTGYASPEMLQGKKYQGPEVDVWSLGVILYCLLTGTLPFDDDDEDVMRAKVIQGEFDDPVWLSLESRDLIKNILQKGVTKRLTIPQILAHSWFTTKNLTYEPDSPQRPLFPPVYSSSPERDDVHAQDSSEASTQESMSPFIHQSDIGSSTPTTPDDSIPDPFDSTPMNTNKKVKDVAAIHRTPSSSTIRRTSASDLESLSSRLVATGERQPATVIEEDDDDKRKSLRLSPLSWSNSAGSKAPPAHSIRTPARTKRRSVSSTLSDPASPTVDKTPTPVPLPSARDLDFASLLTTPTPIIFSTPMERDLLNTLSTLGFDTAQIVHSVLTDACDAAGAVWWMLKKKAEKKALEGGSNDAGGLVVSSPVEFEHRLKHKWGTEEQYKKKSRSKVHASVQTEVENPGHHHVTTPPPQFAFVPPTPTFVKPSTPPRPVTPTRLPMLSPSSSTITGEMSSSRSYPSTPGGSMKEKDSSKGRKPRSGSVSIMQRATTALEAAGLVRKKSSEAVREEKEKERERSREAERDRRMGSGEEPRSSHGSGGSSKLTKSPPHRSSKEKEYVLPSTPPPAEQQHNAPQVGSPWVLADARRESISHPHHPRAAAMVSSVNAKGEMLHSHSTPNFSDVASPAAMAAAASKSPPAAAPNRNRANLLTAFRLWFNEDRKGKRKDSGGVSSPPGVGSQGTYRGMPTPGVGKRRGSNSRHRPQRPSMSSRRSSSVNSRRSSVTSVQMMVLDSPQVPTRRSFGSHTPNSERDHSSRPSSIRSLSMQPRHRKSPSASSAGSTHLRAASPMQKYHGRAGSGSSSTRVVRQPVARPLHARSNSTASSIHSPTSSRPTSFYEPSESDGPRTASPYRSRARRSTDDSSSSTGRRSTTSSAGATTFVQKRQGPFMSPITHGYGYGGTVGKSSWKKSWGLEPPGWQSRTAHLPVEVLAISPANEQTSIRDVFSGRHSLSLGGDESDWVDEDDDIPAFAGGLGQMGSSAATAGTLSGFVGSGGSGGPAMMTLEPTVKLAPAPRGHRNSAGAVKRANSRNGGTSGVGSGGKKGGHSPSERSSPLPADIVYDTAETRTGRRSQLPAARSGPAFRHAIQEEDEGEEE
ncbi:hypothetical protein K443DRAFT_676947 [Laccaria amethystina LaAM-08-1]|uniref:Protein kinase domain-containing protein n=1 Tax=Laccaria amethystina LaAM-08-1 TaxID=1095629 RepID=A0A0C9WV50_9AGAR|nr:hypothetical protein K443DRAFT_676947 [Laccaria amethystina LaAM-08-1]